MPEAFRHKSKCCAVTEHVINGAVEQQVVWCEVVFCSNSSPPLGNLQWLAQQGSEVSSSHSPRQAAADCPCFPEESWMPQTQPPHEKTNWPPNDSCHFEHSLKAWITGWTFMDTKFLLPALEGDSSTALGNEMRCIYHSGLSRGLSDTQSACVWERECVCVCV